MTLCSEAALAGNDGHTIVAVTLRCMMRDCPHCAPIYRARLAERIRDGRGTVFLTLKGGPGWLTPPDEQAAIMAKAWAIIRRRAARVGVVIEFLAVFENGETCQPHLHIAIRLADGFTIRWFERWFRAVWLELVGTSDVNVQAIYDLPGLARYMSKSPHLFAGRRRFWTSRNWATIRRSIERFIRDFTGIVRATIDQMEARCIRDGRPYERVSRNKIRIAPP